MTQQEIDKVVADAIAAEKAADGNAPVYTVETLKANTKLKFKVGSEVAQFVRATKEFLPHRKEGAEWDASTKTCKLFKKSTEKSQARFITEAQAEQMTEGEYAVLIIFELSIDNKIVIQPLFVNDWDLIGGKTSGKIRCEKEGRYFRYQCIG